MSNQKQDLREWLIGYLPIVRKNASMALKQIENLEKRGCPLTWREVDNLMLLGTYCRRLLRKAASIEKSLSDRMRGERNASSSEKNVEKNGENDAVKV